MVLAALPLFLNLGAGEIFIIVLVIVMLFGADKLPEITRTLGRSMREMRNAAGEIQRELETSAAEVQRELNLQQHIDEVNEAAQKMAGDLNEGINAETPVAPANPELTTSEVSENEIVTEENIIPPTPPVPNTDDENPLVPPDAIKRS